MSNICQLNKILFQKARFAGHDELGVLSKYSIILNSSSPPEHQSCCCDEDRSEDHEEFGAGSSGARKDSACIVDNLQLISDLEVPCLSFVVIIQCTVTLIIGNITLTHCYRNRFSQRIIPCGSRRLYQIVNTLRQFAKIYRSFFSGLIR